MNKDKIATATCLFNLLTSVAKFGAAVVTLVTAVLALVKVLPF